LGKSIFQPRRDIGSTKRKQFSQENMQVFQRDLADKRYDF
jgi:hypothetical protein